MKKILSLMMAVCVLLTLVPAASAELTDDISAYLAAIDMDYAYNLALTLSTDTSMHDNVLGFRTSGSEAEHKAADFIASEMEKIGLSDVEKIAVDVDAWQFDGASLTIAGTDINYTIAAYMATGTGADGLTAEIVDCGTGFAADYEGKDVAGKIALVGVDQWNEAWIDQYIYEAEQQGAAALVTYDIDGYGRWSDDVYQIQDVCCEDIMPVAIVTANQGASIAEAIAAGSTECTLIINSTVGPGTSYDVVGRIPGKSSEQQFIVSGHYDMYFTGFQDDCSAIATAMSIGKAIIDSGYQPEYDILIVAHGAEEWGAQGTEFDWTRGAWELINNVHPEWAEKTIAMFNFELSAFDDGGDTFMISCVPEYASLVDALVRSGVLDAAAEGYAGGISTVSIDTTTMEDGVSYRNAGVPYFLNVTDTCADIETAEGEYGWTQLHYHTDSDDASTYCERVMKANIGVFGAICVYLDQTPAMALDLTATCDDLNEAFDTGYAMEAGVDLTAWDTAMQALRDAANQRNSKIADINARYAVAETEEEMAAIRAEGEALNKTTLAAFKAVQDGLIGIEFSSDIVIRHTGYQDNLMILDGVIAALENGELTNDDSTGALDLAWGINAATEYGYYLFTPAAADKMNDHVDPEVDSFKWWGENKGYELARTSSATVSLLGKDAGDDFSEEIATYTDARAEQLALLGTAMTDEITAMNEIAAMLGE